MVMFIKQQVPSVCPQKTVRFPPVLCEPFEWLQSSLPPGILTDIDGFTVNEPKGLVTGLMQKREYDPKFYEIFNDPDKVVKTLFSIESELEWKLRYELSRVLGSPLYAIFWPFDYPNKKYEITNPIVTFSVVAKVGKITFTPLFFGDIEDLVTLIRKCRGRSFANVKPLNAAATKMECYLASNTKDPWPGNLDGFTWNNKKFMFSAILEFKTHNDPRYTIESQYFGQWGLADTRRYNVLDIIQKNLQAKGNIVKFIFAVWGTDKSHTKVKIQKINNLKVTDETYIERPFFTRTTLTQFTNQFFSFIDK